MSMEPPAPPRLESRVKSLEEFTLNIHARIVELNQDMQASFRQATDEQAQIERRVSERLEKGLQSIRDEMQAMEERLLADRQASEQRILSAFEKLLEVVSPNKTE